MRKALALAAFLAMAPYAQAQESAAAATATGSHTMNAEYRLRFQYDNNVAGSKDIEPTSRDFALQRLKLGGGFKASDQLSLNYTLLHNASWGSNNYSYGALGTGDGDGGTSRARLNGTNDAENMILVQEAYGTWMVSDNFMLRFGRGSFTMGDGTVIHDNDWDATPVAFEGVLATYEMEVGRLSGFAVRFAEYDDQTDATAQDPEANSVGLTWSQKVMPEFMNRMDVHVNQITKAYTGPTGVDTAAASFGQDILRYGISLGGDVAMFDWRAVYNAHTGDYRNINGAGTNASADGHMYEAEIGMKFEEFMNSRAYIYYHQDSGDSTAGGNDGTGNPAADGKIGTYDPYFYYRHGNAGLMDIFLWGNLTDIAVGYTFQTSEVTNFGIHYHMFQKTEGNGGVNAGLWGSNMLANGTTTDKDLGQEIDVEVTHAYANGLMMTGRLGAFMPGAALEDLAGANSRGDMYGTAFLEAKMNF